MGDVGEILMSVLSTIRVPKPGDRVHKDECALSFASPVSSFFFLLSVNLFCFRINVRHFCFGQILYFSQL